MPASTIGRVDTVDLDQPTTEPSAPVAVAEPGDDAIEVAPAPPHVEARIMDPAELVIGHNVRPEDQIDLDAHPKQVDSIRQLGVRDPILAERGPDGQIVVVDGQVRALIARTLGLREVPVYIQDTDRALTDPERLIDRAITQINLNDRRIELTESARAAGVTYMLDLGATTARIAEGLQTSTASIRRAGKIGRSTTARTLLDEQQYSLDQLQVIADYEALDDRDAIDTLTNGGPRNFDLRAGRVASDRAEQRQRLTAALPYAAAGFAIATTDPAYLDHDRLVPAEDLVTTDQTPVSESAIWADPARWLVALERIEDAELVDEATGELIDPDTVDFDADGETPPAEGLRSAHGLIHRDVWLASYFLAVGQLEAAGLQPRTTATDLTTADDGVDPAEAVARAEAEQADAAARRAERRKVIELNKRGAAAKDRRIEFLARLLSGRTLPAGAAQFVAESLARDSGLLSGTRARTFAMQRLGLETTAELIERATGGTTTDGWRFVLGLVLAAHESALGKDSWRQHRWLGANARHYLHYLAQVGEAKGFALVDVELATAGDLDPDTIDIDPGAHAVSDDLPSELGDDAGPVDIDTAAAGLAAAA
ncbi:ParB N-terminal domain-containing protein [Nocardia sp. NPDC058379]|uniref:ParB N-terminal domain-containing protein n=1 Tax=unclassified Nocardia TaxID=2637762 RepID=UPI003649597C